MATKEHLSSCKTEEEDGRCSPGRSQGTDVWFHSGKCPFYRSVEMKCSFLYCSLAENTEKEVEDRVYQATQVKELKAGQTVLSFEGASSGATHSKKPFPRYPSKWLQAFCRLYWRREALPQKSTDDDSTPNKSQTTRPRRQLPCRLIEDRNSSLQSRT